VGGCRERLGAGHVRVFGGAIPKGATEAQAISWAVEVLKRGAEYSGSKGILIGVEDDGGLTTTAEPTLAIIKQTDSPWAGMNLDTGNFRRTVIRRSRCASLCHQRSLQEEIASENGTKEKADWIADRHVRERRL